MTTILENIRTADTKALVTGLDFFDVPALRSHYTALISEIREELASRGLRVSTARRHTRH